MKGRCAHHGLADVEVSVLDVADVLPPSRLDQKLTPEETDDNHLDHDVSEHSRFRPMWDVINYRDQMIQQRSRVRVSLFVTD